MSRLRLPIAADPQVSLVVVVYGGYALARATLAAVAEAADVDHELIVVDNASPDGAGIRLRDETDGARFLLNDRNLGFGAAVNLGVLHARGPMVGVLNADIEPQPGFLSPLVSALAGNRRAAAVTPLYLGDDGAVLEAGGLMGADGRGYGHGVGLAPGDTGLAFSREVDYGSAAALVVRRDRFHEVGGLDPAYGLGYYEDADLCFSLREAGYVTLYEPRSRVCHRRHGAFDRQSRLRQLERNRPLFTGRFPDQLRGRPLLHRPPFNPHADLTVRDWWAPQHLLVIDPEGALDGFASGAQRLWPRARVTLVGRARSATGGDSRVERVTDLGDGRRLDWWLERRRFHYGAVVTPRRGADRHRLVLARTQPHARLGVIGEGESAGPDWVAVPDDPEALTRLGFPASRGR